MIANENIPQKHFINEPVITHAELINYVRNHLKTLSNDERIDFIHSCMTDYCSYCGSEHLPCYCHSMYDE